MPHVRSGESAEIRVFGEGVRIERMNAVNLKRAVTSSEGIAMVDRMVVSPGFGFCDCGGGIGLFRRSPCDYPFLT
jgi:hypothetical protein